jgi:8-oxo-dGTP diphosphatase
MVNHIEVIARGFIVAEGQVLLCKTKSKEHWFLPGGHVEMGENAGDALQRELKEEIGMDVDILGFMGVNENRFSEQGKERQEINIIFEATMENAPLKVLESHLEFRWFDMEELVEILVLPHGLKSAVLKWIGDKKIFYSEQ